MSTVAGKVKENIIVSVVSIILTGALIFVGATFRDLQKSNSQLVNKVTALESIIKERQISDELIAQISKNETSIQFIEKILDRE